jgi:hypothetical protein
MFRDYAVPGELLALGGLVSPFRRLFLIGLSKATPRKCAPAPFLSQTKRAVASWAFSEGFPTHGDDIPLRARPRQLVMREATEPRRSAPISG